MLLLLLLCRPPLLISDSDRISATFDRITTVAVLGSFDKYYPKQSSRSLSFGMKTKSQDRENLTDAIGTSQRRAFARSMRLGYDLNNSRLEFN